MTREEAKTLQAIVDEALDEAHANEGQAEMGAINWGDLSCTDVEERRSLLHDDAPTIVVIIEEASPEATGLRGFVGERLEARGYHDVWIETEW